MINLPYIVDGETIVTQSNSCLLFLGQKLGIDSPELMIDNHQVLDQTMDLRNDLMKITYGPAGKDYEAALTNHMGGAAKVCACVRPSSLLITSRREAALRPLCV